MSGLADTQYIYILGSIILVVTFIYLEQQVSGLSVNK